jgi:hypothetical protein
MTFYYGYCYRANQFLSWRDERPPKARSIWETRAFILSACNGHIKPLQGEFGIKIGTLSSGM